MSRFNDFSVDFFGFCSMTFILIVNDGNLY